MQKTQDGQGTTKLVTAEQHNETRQAAKAHQRQNRKGKGRLTASGNLFAEIAQERINARGLEMLDIFDTLMVSSSPKAHEVLRAAALKYVPRYTASQNCALYERHQSAKEAALNDIMSENLSKFAATQLDRAERATRPAR